MDGFILYGVAAGAATFGYIIGAVMRRGADAEDAALWKQCEETASKHHDRCADALATLRAGVDRALAAETPNAAPAVKRICRMLRGEA